MTSEIQQLQLCNLPKLVAEVPEVIPALAQLR